MLKFLFLLLSVIATRPQSNPEGRLLTMEEANIVSSLYPSSRLKSVKPDFGPYREENGSVWCDSLLVAGAHGAVSYGTMVSRDEFGCSQGLFPSPDFSRLAFYRKDESAVDLFPLLDIKSKSLKNIRYPMAGTASEKLQLLVYDRKSGSTISLEISDFDEERYICYPCWRNNEEILVQLVDRSQHHLQINLYSAVDGHLIKRILSEEDPAWVEPYEITHFLSEDYFVYSSDCRDGYKNLYLCNLDGVLTRIVQTDADIFYLGWQKGWLYYLSAQDSPAEQQLYRVKIQLPKNAGAKAVTGKPQRLSKESGWHNVYLDSDGYTDVFTSFGNPGWIKRYSLSGKELKTIQINEDPLKDYACPEMEFGTVESADGKYQNHYRLLKPLNFDPGKKYPLIVYVYGGPHSQMVNAGWLGNIRLWEMLMAQKGYVVYVQDNRGTQRHGSDYEKAINRCCGQAEMEDQLHGLEKLLENEWIDRERIGVHGWSYGGFMTLSLVLNNPQLFKAAAAGGPVIDWKWYEVMYGERYMDKPEDNPEGYAKSSLMGREETLKTLKTELLICQGAVDPTVVWQNSLSFLKSCINAGKQVEYFPFPCAEHNMRGQERVYLYRKITDFFDKNL